MFKALVHSQEDFKHIPLVKEMHYLKESLTGKISRIIRRIPLSIEDYEAAWDHAFNTF